MACGKNHLKNVRTGCVCFYVYKMYIPYHPQSARALRNFFKKNRIKRREREGDTVRNRIKGFLHKSFSLYACLKKEIEIAQGTIEYTVRKKFCKSGVNPNVRLNENNIRRKIRSK